MRLPAWERWAVAAEVEHREGDHGGGALEPEGHPGKEADLGVGALDEPVGQAVLEGRVDRRAVFDEALGELDEGLLAFEVANGGSWVKLRNPGNGTLAFDGYAVRGMTKPDSVVTLDYKAAAAPPHGRAQPDAYRTPVIIAVLRADKGLQNVRPDVAGCIADELEELQRLRRDYQRSAVAPGLATEQG